MGVAELEHRLSDAEIREWSEYYALEPFGDDRVEIMLAQILGLISSVFGSKLSSNDFIVSKRAKNKKDIRKEIALCFG